MFELSVGDNCLAQRTPTRWVWTSDPAPLGLISWLSWPLTVSVSHRFSRVAFSVNPELFCFCTAVVSVTVPEQTPTMTGPSQIDVWDETVLCVQRHPTTTVPCNVSEKAWSYPP